MPNFLFDGLLGPIFIAALLVAALLKILSITEGLAGEFGAMASQYAGKVVGKVKIMRTSQEKEFNEGEILVSGMTTPDFVPAMKKAVAIVTNTGGMTSHAAIVSRELGVPCIVGTGNATKELAEGIKVTVDGTHGNVYEGIIVSA